jgi:hypothetical protein
MTEDGELWRGNLKKLREDLGLYERQLIINSDNQYGGRGGGVKECRV